MPPLGSTINMIGLYLPKLLVTFKSSPSISIDAKIKLSSVILNLDLFIILSKVLFGDAASTKQ